MDHDVGAELERALEVGRGERVVDRDQGAVGVGDVGHRPEVQHLEQRVGRGLGQHEGGALPHHGLEGLPRAHVGGGESDPELA
jgi:hypothetical protein